MIKQTLASLVAIASLTAASGMVCAETVSFSIGQTSGEFHCSVDTLNPLATASIDTDHVEVSGFCSGQPYVTSPGHISGMPVSNLKKYYFKVKKDIEDSGSVTINTSSGNVTCSAGKGDADKAYGNGDYC